MTPTLCRRAGCSTTVAAALQLYAKQSIAIFTARRLPSLRREPIDQRQPVEALAKSPREIVDPALAAQPSPLPDLLHGHAENQDLMHQRGAVGTEFTFGAVQP